MSPKIPITRPCAARFCGQIELAPSRRLATLSIAWLTVWCLMVLTTVTLPLPARIGICLAGLLGGARATRCTFLLAGRSPARGLRWDESHLFVVVGRSRNEVCVTLAPGSFRWGRFGMLLRLRGRDGQWIVFIDAGRQEEAAIRALAARLKWPVRQADTIPTQDLTCVTRYYKSFD
jgi:hypothetical protein